MFGTNPNSLTLFNLNKTALDKNLKHLVQSLLIKTLTERRPDQYRSIYTAKSNQIGRFSMHIDERFHVRSFMYVYKSTTAAFKNLQDKI